MLGIIIKDRYRPLFCPADYYSANQDIFLRWKTNFMTFSKADQIKAWTICLSCLRRPKDWFGGARPSAFLITPTPPSLIQVKELFLGTAITWPARLDPEMDLQNFLNTVRIKPLPESALRSLFFLGQKNYPLLITASEPTPFELLEIQIKGHRVITFDDRPQLWPQKLYGERDPLSFIIHDLIHADHFFKDTKQHQGQIGFYKFVDKIKNDDHLLKLFENDNFKKGFEYIISDMNAHPVHLFQTLKALLYLTVLDDILSAAIWNQWVLRWNLLGTEADAVQKINTQLFSNIHANQIEVMCFDKSLETGLAIRELVR